MNIRAIVAAVIAAASLSLLSCSSTSGPSESDELGGEVNLELTEVGADYGTYLEDPAGGALFDTMRDSVVVTARANGLVTYHAEVTFDSIFVARLDTALGTAGLPDDVKRQAIDRYVQRFGATLDTADKGEMHLRFDLKLRVTSEGIQEYVSSGGDPARPRTVVRYSWNVGNSETFTNSEGVRVTRTVTYRSTTDDYPIAFWNIKVIKVEQTQEDPLIEKITYIANHKFGLVGVILRTTLGKEIKLGIFPPTL